MIPHACVCVRIAGGVLRQMELKKNNYATKGVKSPRVERRRRRRYETEKQQPKFEFACSSGHP